MDLTQDVGTSTFKADLESVGIETVSSALERHWIVEGTGRYGKQLAAKAEERISKENPTFIDAIDNIAVIPIEEKTDPQILSAPVGEEIEDVDVETWPMSHGRLEEFENVLYKIAKDGGGDVVGMFYADDYCAARVQCNAAIFNGIASLPEVARMSRPTQMQASASLASDIMDYGTIKSPDPDAPGILVIDSGIVKHPLLEPAIAGLIPVNNESGADANMYDDEGHGTCVAGVAVYGDVQACVDNGVFEPKVRLYSAKVMKRGPDGGAVFDGLIDGKIKHAVDEIAAQHPSCRIVNLSLGDSTRTILPCMPQPRLASLIDRLSVSHKSLLFVVSAGNIEDSVDRPYPHYLLDRPPVTRLIDPATSAHAITVGSIFQRRVGLGYADHPSPTTRVGPGLADMLKPDVVDYGGGYAGPDSRNILTINMAGAKDGRLFTFDSGTSMSAPRVAHTLAMMQADMPDASRNLLKALLISSAEIPSLRPPPLDTLSTVDSKDMTSLSHVYGHGKPNLGRAIHSQDARVVFVHDGGMRLNHAELFTVKVPAKFTTTPGRKTIEVTLAFDPPTNAKIRPYLGVTMKYHLYKNVDINRVRMCYEDVGKTANNNKLTLDAIKNNRITLNSAGRVGTGTHQKSWTRPLRDMAYDPTYPLVLVVITESKWKKEPDYIQSYAIAVTLRHSLGIDIYSALRSENLARARGGASQ